MKRIVVLAGLLVSTCATAAAQEAGQVGISADSSGLIGVMWHVSDRIAVRPEVGFATSSSDSEFSVDSHGVNVGGSMWFYTAKWDNVRAYVRPRILYTRVTSDSGGTVGISLKNSAYDVIGSFGAQYTPHRRFAVFGDIGVGYSHSESSTATDLSIVLPPGLGSSRPTISTTTRTGFETRTGVGVIFYFK